MKQLRLLTLGLLAIGVIAVLLFPRRVMIGPVNPGAEDGSDGWWVGASGTGYLFVDHTDPASGNSDFTLGITNEDKNNSVGWRSVVFPLGPAAGVRRINFSFAYKLVGDVNPGDDVMVQLRFYNRTTNWIRETDFLLGDSSHDSAMSHYKTFTVENIPTPHAASLADINVTANVFSHHWSSGDARFDDFSLTTTTYSALPIVFAVALFGVAGTVVWGICFRQR